LCGTIYGVRGFGERGRLKGLQMTKKAAVKDVAKTWHGSALGRTKGKSGVLGGEMTQENIRPYPSKR